MLRHSNWVAVNKDLVKLVGCNSAYLLCYLADKHQYFASRNEIRPDGFFFATAADVEEELGLTTREQDGAIKRLVLANFIETAVKGIPAKRYFRFLEASEQALENALLGAQNCKTSFDKSAKLDTTKAQNSVQQNVETNYKEHTKISNEKSFLSGDLQSPFENIKQPDEKAEFSEWLHNNGFTRLSKTNFFLNKEKSCAKKEKLGEVAYLATLGAIDAYLGDNPKYLDDKKAFPLIFDRFAVSPELIACKNDFNRVFSAKFNSKLALHGRAAEIALNGIISQLKDLGGDMPILEKITRFFDAIAKLPKFASEEAWNPTFINSGFGIIISLLNNNKTNQPAKVETFKERDERLAKEKDAERQLRQFEQERIKAEKAQIVRFIDAGYPLTPEMLQSAAYRELYGNGETF